MLRAYKTFGYNLIESRAHTTGSAKAVRSMSLMSTQFVVTCIQGFASCYQEVPCIWRRSIEHVHRRCNYWYTIQIMSRLIGFLGNCAGAHMDLLVSDLNKICALRMRSGNDSVMFLILVTQYSRAYEAIVRQYCLCVYVSYKANRTGAYVCLTDDKFYRASETIVR